MLEIFAVIMLANANKRNALARGRRPGWFIAMTYLFWFGLEIVGLLIGMSLELGYVTYVIALGMAGIGGLASYLATKHCAPGDYVRQQIPMQGYTPQGPYGAPPFAQPEPAAEPLDEPASIEIIRDNEMRGGMMSWTFILNGETAGRLGSGASRWVTTKQRQNTLRAVSEDGRECQPLRFNVENGGSAAIRFGVDRFVPEGCTGIMPLHYASPAGTAVPPYGQSAVPPYGTPMPPPYGPGMPPPYGPFYTGGPEDGSNPADKEDKPE